jgi:hypothetical protein
MPDTGQDASNGPIATHPCINKKLVGYNRGLAYQGRGAT